MEGQFVGDKIEGFAQVIRPDGAHYIGECKGGNPHGQGRMTDKNDNVEEGQFVQGKF